MKKIIGFLVAVLVFQSLINVTQAALFSDVPDSHPNYTAISFLRSRSIINGYEDGTFRPDRPVSRVEFLKIVLLASGNPVVAGDLDRSAFSDVPMGTWYFGFVNRALALGVASGYPDGLFRPDRTVSRIEAIKMMLRSNRITEASLSSDASYSDIEAGSWAVPYARFAQIARLFDSIPGNLLRPNEAMTRGQVAEMVYRFYQYRPDLLPTTTATSSPTLTPTLAPTSTPAPTPTASAPTSEALRISALSVTPEAPNVSAGCASTVYYTFIGNITTNGSAGTFTYYWEGENGYRSTDQSFTTTAGVSNYNFRHDAGSPGTGVYNAWRRLYIGAPFNNVSSPATISIDCTRGTSATPAPTPTSTPSSALLVTSVGLSASGRTDANAPCSVSTNVNVKGGISTNGQPGTIRYYYDLGDGRRSPEMTYTFSAGETGIGTSVINYSATFDTNHVRRLGSIRLMVVAPNNMSSGGVAYTLRCSDDDLPRTHQVTGATFTSQQPGVRDGAWVCGRNNNFTLRGRLTLATPPSGGRIAYNWLFNTGSTSPTFTVDVTSSSTNPIILPEYIWSIPSGPDGARYTAWLNVLTPNALTSPSWSIDKPRCGSL
jgi:hypothetical protein